MEEAVNRLEGIALNADCEVMSLVFKAFARVLEEQQEELDEEHYRW